METGRRGAEAAGRKVGLQRMECLEAWQGMFKRCPMVEWRKQPVTAAAETELGGKGDLPGPGDYQLPPSEGLASCTG